MIVTARLLRDRRRSLLWWSVGVVGLVLFTVALFPSVDRAAPHHRGVRGGGGDRPAGMGLGRGDDTGRGRLPAAGLLALSDAVQPLPFVSPWHWYLGRNMLAHGVAPDAIVVPLLLSAVVFAAGAAAFLRRDLR